MAITTGLSRPLAQVQSGSTPTIYNVAVPLAATEVSQTLSLGVKKFLVRVRGHSNLQLAFDPGQSGVDYISIPSGTTYSEDQVMFSGTLYFQTNKPSQVVEILEWV